MPDTEGSVSLVAITDKAKAKLLGILGSEPDGENLALWLEVAGTRGQSYAYDMWFQAVAEATADHVVEQFGDLRVVLKNEDVDKLRGSTLNHRQNLMKSDDPGGFVFDNPNSPSPDIPVGDIDLSGDIPTRVSQVLDQRINPAIASHGGVAELVAVEGDTAYLRLGGGCQGCGMAAVTLSQGIEVAILEMVPEIKNVVDVTDHAGGDNPYYEAAKK